MLHGQTLNQITNINGLVNRAARQVLMDIDAMETKRIEPITGTVFNGVWDYPAPADLKGNKVIDIRPQILRFPNDVWGQQYNQAFDVAKNQPTLMDSFTMNFDSGVKSLRINSPTLPPPIIVNTCDYIVGDGTWIANDGATDLTVDNVNFVSGSGSLEFNMLNPDHLPSYVGLLLNDTIEPLDLSSHYNQSTFFLYTYLPTGSEMARMYLYISTTDDDYWQFTATTNQQGASFQDGWNTIAFPWNDNVTVGSPDPSNITGLEIQWTDNTENPQIGVRLGQISSNMGRILDIEYYSKYMFRNASTGVFQENVTAASDLINLDTDSYNILLYQCAYLAAQQQQGLDALFYDSNFFLQKYNDAVSQYKAAYKSEIQVPQATYYKMNKGGYGLWSGRWNQ